VTGWRFDTGVQMVALAAVACALGFVTGSLPMLLFGAAVAWLAMLRVLPRGGLTAAVAIGLLYTNAAVLLPSEIGAPPVAGLAPQALLGILVLARLFVHNRGLVTTPAFRALLVHCAALTVASLTALDAAPVTGSMATFLVEGVLLWFLAINAIDDRRRLEQVLGAFVVSAAFLGGLSVLQYVTESYDNDYLGFAQVDERRADLLLDEEEDVAARLGGSVGEQNRYAQILLVVVPIALALAHRRLRSAPVFQVGAVLIVAGIVLTASRGAALGLVATLFVMAALRLLSVRSLAIMAAVALGALLVLPNYRDRILSSVAVVQSSESEEAVDNSTLSRITQTVAAYDMFADHPALGVGPGGYPGMYEEYAERVGLLVKDEARQAHNLYLGVASESGAVGLATFLAVFGFVLTRLYRAWRSSLHDRTLWPLPAGMMAAIAAYLVTGIFLHIAYARFLWVLLAVADVTARIVRHEALHPAPVADVPEPSRYPAGARSR
jgi:putative inorganic carbon (hco3(-)) transporter